MKTQKNKANNVELATTKKVNVNDLQNLINLQKSKIDTDKKIKVSTKEKNFIYKFQLDSTLTEKEQKKKRSKLRRNLQNIVNTIIVDNLKETNLTNIPLFLDFYKLNYINNNFTLESITNSTEETKINEINLILNLTKLFLSQEVKETKKETTKKEKIKE